MQMFETSKEQVTIQEKGIRTWAFCIPNHMESELILFQLHYSQMRDCCCQCEKPEPQSRHNKAIDLLQIFQTKGGK